MAVAKTISAGVDTPTASEQAALLRLLGDVRVRARRLIWIYGLSATLAVLLSLTTIAALADYLFHIDDSITRLILGLGVLAATGRTAWLTLVRPLTQPLTNLTLARQFEKHDGSWKDQLSSVVQFIETGFSPSLGSPHMQQRVVNDALARLPRLRTVDVLQSRAVLHLAWAATGVLLLTAGLVGLDQSSAAIALERLVRPFAAIAWPKQVDLVFYDEQWKAWETLPSPLRIVQGETLQVVIENRLGALPDEIALTVRSADGTLRTEPVRRVALPDAEGTMHDVAVATMLAQPGKWSLRAVGGDDDEMPWQMLEVIPPPTLDNLQVRLIPPPYSALPSTTLPKNVGHIDGLIGTEVEIRATANRPLSRAHLRIKDHSGLPIELSEDDTHVTARFRIEESGKYAYWFDLRDREGFQNPNARRYEIEGRADAVPEVTLLQPRDDLTVTPDAVIPLEIEVRDDLGLDQLFLELSLGDMSSGAPVRELLTTALDHLLPTRGKTDETASTQQVKELRWKEQWSLSPLALTEGSRLNFVAAATDLYDLSPDHVGRSRSRTLTVVSTAQKTAELAVRQEQMLKTLVDVQRLQKQARDAIRDLNLDAQKTGNLSTGDFDRFQRVEREQEQIAKQLFGPVTSVQEQAREWLSSFENNGLKADDMRERVADLTQELGWLNREIYPSLESEMTQTGKRLWNRDDNTASSPDNSVEKPAKIDDAESEENAPRETKPPSADETAPPEKPREKFSSRAPKYSLARIEDYQSTALETLDDLVHTISDWKDLRTVTNEWQELIDEQAEATQQTAEAARETLTKNLSELSDEQQAQLAKTAAKQQGVADRLQQFRERVAKMTAEEDSASQQERDVLAELSESLAERPLAGRMQEAAAAIRKNELGQAGQTQQKIEAELAEMRDILKQKRETDTEALIKKIKEFEETADGLIAQQKDVAETAEELLKKDDEDPAERLELVKRQQQNIERNRRLAHGLRREGLDSSREPFERAGEEMQGASDEMLADQPEQLRKRHDDADQALQQGRRELAKARREMERRLAREIVARLEQEVQGLLERQKAMTAEIHRLQSEYLAKGRWTRGQLKTLRDTGAAQTQIAADVTHIADRLQEVPVFAYSLKHAADLMTRVSQRLNDRQVDEQTVGFSASAEKQLADLLAALAKPEDENQSQPLADQPDADQPDADRQNDGPQTPDLPQTAQVKLLKELQSALRQKTAAFHVKHPPDGELSPEADAEQNRLADEQQALFELAETLLQSLANWDPTAAENDDSEPADDAVPAERQETPETSQRSNVRPTIAFASFQPPVDEESPPAADQLSSPAETALKLRQTAQQVIASMQAAQAELSRGEAGSPAQNQQQQAEQAIDDLLKQLDELSKQPPPQSDNSQDSQEQNQQRQRQQQQQNETENGSETSGNPAGQRRNDDQPQDSTESAFPGEVGEEKLTTPQKLAKDVWGHLPEAVREQMLNMFSEKYLPRYDDLIRRYYEALAEEEMKADRGVNF